MTKIIKQQLLTIAALLLLFQFSNAQSLNYGYAHDITNGVTFDGSPFSIAAQNGFPGDIEFSGDGLAMFVLDPTNDEIDIYKLSTPFETSVGVSVNGTSFDVSAEELNPNGFAFGNDGLKMYLTGSSGDDVTAYTLSNAYDLSTGVSVDGTPFSLISQFLNPRDLVISTDGSKMFVLEQDEIFQYSLSIAYRVLSGATYDNVSYSVATEDTQGYSLSVNMEGTKMFILGSDGDDINQYSLVTPFNLASGVSFDGTPFSFTSQESSPRGIALSTEGDKLFIVGTSGDDVNQYSLTVDNDFEEAGANDGSITGSLNIDITGDTFTSAGSTLSSPTDYSITKLPAGLTSSIAVAADGLSATLTLGGNASDHQRINNINNLEFEFENGVFTSDDASSVLNATSYESNFGIDFDNNSALLIYGNAFDITQGITNDGTPYSVSSQETNPYGITFNNDGSKMFIAGVFGDDVNQYSLTTPFDITSGVTFDGSPFNVFSEEASLRDITFNNYGTKMYVIGGGNGDEINQYSLSNPFNITSGVSYDGNPFLIFEESETRGLVFSTDGYTLLVLGSNEINQYSLTTPFETTYGVTFDGSPFSLSSQETQAVSIALSADGLKMLILGSIGDDVNQYSLSIPFDITAGVAFEGSPFSISSETTEPRSFAFSADGSKMYMIGSTGGVNQYSLNTEDNFTETTANTGLVESANLAAVIRITGETFSNAGGTLSQGSHYSISNLPTGLIPTLTVAADGLSATLSLSGSVSNHQASNSLEDLIFSFEDGAFTGGDASLVANTTSASSGFDITFIDNPVITYGFDAFDFDAGPTFDGSPFSISGKEASAKGITFNSDGTRMFIIGNSSQRAHQYDLDNPYDVTGGVTFGSSTSTVFGAGSSGMVFNGDGSKLFVLLGASGPTKTVSEYTLATNFDLSSTLSFVTSFDVGSEELQPQGLNFNNDGSKMYIVGSNGNEVNQYSLSSPFSLGSVSFDGNESISGVPLDISFSNDGLTMFILGFTFDNVARYRLNTPFDITAGFVTAGDAFNFAAQDSNPVGITFSPDGSKMFMVGSTGDDVNQYSIEAGGFNETAANAGAVEGSLTISLSGDTFTNAGGSLSGSDYTINNLPASLTSSIDVAADGLTAELTFSGTADNHQSANDISSLNFTFENSAFSTDNAGGVFNAVNAESDFGIDFEDNARLVYGFDVFDLQAGVTYDGSPYSVLSEEGNVSDLAFSTDGSKMFIIGNTGDEVNQYSLGTAFDVTSGVTFDGSPLSILSEAAASTSFAFSPDGTKMFVLGLSGDEVNQYSLSNAFDITSGVTFDGSPFSISSEETSPTGLAFSADGAKMFVLGLSGDDVNQYNLSNSFDVTSGASFSGITFSVANEETSPHELEFSTDGLKMFVIGFSGDDVNQYALNSPFDLSGGATFERNFSIQSEESSPVGLAFSADGSKMYVLGSAGDDVNQYSINQEMFTEAVLDDGSVDGSLTIQIFSDTFTNAGGNLTGSDYSIDNLPSGLNSTLAVAADGLSASLTLGGNATSNFDSDDISSLQFTFENSAFTTTIAADVINAISAESNAGIDFFGTVSAPTDITIDNSTIAENETTGTLVGSLSTTDVDAGETYTYTLVAGSGDVDNASFTINGDQLKSAAMFDFENKNSYSIRVNTNDGNGGNFPKEFTITITDTPDLITWNGATWNNGTGPLTVDDAVINGNYSIDLDDPFDVNNLTINPTFTLTVDENNLLEVGGDLTNNGSLVVESGSSLLTYEANTFSGNDVEIRRNTRFLGGQYSFVGTPVMQNANVTDATIGSYVYYYDEFESYENDNGADRWKTMTGQLVPATGYTQANQLAIVFTGVPNTGMITHTGTYTDQGLAANKGWNLVANPYAAAINVTSFIAANMHTSQSVYIWDDNGSDDQRGTNSDYIVANGTMHSSIDPDASRYNFHMGSAQAFFVKLSGIANTTITFTEGMRVDDSNADGNFFRETPLPIARINLTDDQGLFKQAVVGFADDATEDELNRVYDAQAFNATSDFGLFTMKAGRSLTLNGMTQDWESVQLQLNAKEAGQYQISIQLKNYDNELFLRDNLTGEVTDLRSGGYSFATQAGIHTDRFELISSPSEVLGFEENTVLVYAYNSILHIQQTSDDAREYQLFNMNGQKLLTKSVSSKEEVNLSVYAKGIYLVFDGQKTHKIILK